MKRCSRYPGRFISRFMDNEVTADEHRAFLNHLDCCSTCRETLESYRAAGDLFRRHVSDQAAKIPLVRMPGTPAKARPFSPFGLGLKLASVAAAALILVFAFFPEQQELAPSAIVDSIDTDYASVLIIEAPDTGHTIIWFSQDLQEDHG